jgi:MYXO-CTERM domain-containing protein
MGDIHHLGQLQLDHIVPVEEAALRVRQGSTTSGRLLVALARGRSSLPGRAGFVTAVLLLLVAQSAWAQPMDGGGGTRPGTDGGAICPNYDGGPGPGSCCTNDIDCLGCGWVCSWPRGHFCIPSMEGDPGWCSQDSDCACAGQVCSGTHCTPAANPQCICNSDCPEGLVCNQFTFTCLPQPTPGTLSCTEYYGICGCGFQCGAGTNGPCQAQGDLFPPECASDVDCNVCETGKVCVFNPASPTGQFTCSTAYFDAGWCLHSLGGSSTGGGSAGSTSGGSSTGGEMGDGGKPDGGSSAGGCSCGGTRPAGSEPLALLALGLLLVARGQRRARLSRS